MYVCMCLTQAKTHAYSHSRTHTRTNTGMVDMEEYSLSLYQQGSADKGSKYWFGKHDLNSVRILLLSACTQILRLAKYIEIAKLLEVV